MSAPFLPTTLEEARRLGWHELDVVIVTGDAYVDHPSFGAAAVGRTLEAAGFRVGIIPQPDWRRREDFRALGRPRLFFGVTAGNLDSLVTNLTPTRRRRRKDAYSPGGRAGLRPDRATIVYANRLRELFPGVPIVLGGVEASMRRLAHYDWWDGRVRRSLLLDAKAEYLLYGMAEATTVALARALASGEEPFHLPGLATVRASAPEDAVVLPPFEEVCRDADAFCRAQVLIETRKDAPLAQEHAGRWVVVNPPPPPLSPAELDAVNLAPYARRWHPRYDAAGGVPALEPVLWSITSHRGCPGDCSFCALAGHQGRIVTSRTIEGLVEEAQRLAADERFRGTITDLGGPTGNGYGMGCARARSAGVCPGRSCAAGEVCRALKPDHRPLLEALAAVAGVPGVKHVYLASGVRHDLLLADRNCREVLRRLIRDHVGGQMRVAPEHVSPRVLELARKPPYERFLEFRGLFYALAREEGRDVHLLPYFVAGLPGAGPKEAVGLALAVRQLGFFPEQAQLFTPTPMTRATCMYYTGKVPETLEPVWCARDARERLRQRALLHFADPRNERLVREALIEAGRRDLIGTGETCLVPPTSSTRRRRGADRRSRGA